MAIWTDPRVFQDTNNINQTILNVYLSENQRYLLTRPEDTLILRDVGTFTTSSTSFTAVDLTSMRLTFTLQRTATVLIDLSGSVSFDTPNERSIYFDVQMDGDIWLSSGTSTKLTLGVKSVASGIETNLKFPIDFRVPFLVVPAGVHYFDLHWRVSASTASLFTNPTLMFSAREIA